jgi:sec-independent protein translocase protein TatA
MLGSTELIAILIAALFLFGPKKLPELARSLGSAVGEFKKAQRASEMQLTHFDAYTRQDENKSTLSDKDEDKEKYETSLQEKDEKIEVKS